VNSKDWFSFFFLSNEDSWAEVPDKIPASIIIASVLSAV
jgi:hypothetical protein